LSKKKNIQTDFLSTKEDVYNKIMKQQDFQDDLSDIESSVELYDVKNHKNKNFSIV
jgi:hypothetical protein